MEWRKFAILREVIFLRFFFFCINASISLHGGTLVFYFVNENDILSGNEYDWRVRTEADTLYGRFNEAGIFGSGGGI